MSDISAPIIQATPYNPDEQLIFNEVRLHWQRGFAETDKRATGRNKMGITSFDEADELFRCWLDENQWPYDALIFDPRIFTMIFEKTSRLIANKPEPRLTPRQGGNILMAKINNVLLEYQWDQAKNGGTMLSKWAMMDMNCRKYGASFALTKWRYETDDKGRPVFDGPEFRVLNNRDCAQDLAATSIENAHWFQHREYVTFHDLERVNDQARTLPIYKNLDKLYEAIAENQYSGGDTRGINWRSRNRAISRIEQDPVGKDPAFKTVEIVTEYRRDRWITFSPRHGVVIRDIPNPYDNWELPIVMLRYYAIDDDLYGLSEIEPIKGLQKSVNAILCQYIDEINMHLYSPVAIGPGVRQHTLEWGKGARWIMNNPNSDFRLVESHSQASQYFNTTYSVLVAAMMNALGESSLGVSNTQPYSKDKTATEVQSLNQQKNARDNFQQIFLQDAMSRLLRLWHSMNQQLLFTDTDQPYYILRIVGKELIEDFIDLGLGDQIMEDEQALVDKETKILDILNQDNEQEATDIAQQQATGTGKDTGNLTPTGSETIANIKEKAQKLLIPKHRVTVKGKKVPKLTTDDRGHMASLYIVKEDLMGDYDYKVDVQTMNVNFDDQRKQARQTAISLLITNPNVSALLAQDQTKPRFKELMVSWLEELGWLDADRYFEPMPQQQPGAPMPQGGAQPVPGQQPGMPGTGPSSALGSGAAQTAPPQQAASSPALQQVFGYYNYSPPNSLQGVPIWIQEKYASKYGTGGAYPGSPESTQ